MREAMEEEMKSRIIGGEGKTAEIDGGYFGGYVKPANLKGDRVTAAGMRTSQASASASASSSSASVMASRSRQCSARKPKL